MMAGLNTMEVLRPLGKTHVSSQFSTVVPADETATVEYLGFWIERKKQAKIN